MRSQICSANVNYSKTDLLCVGDCGFNLFLIARVMPHQQHHLSCLKINMTYLFLLPQSCLKINFTYLFLLPQSCLKINMNYLFLLPMNVFQVFGFASDDLLHRQDSDLSYIKQRLTFVKYVSKLFGISWLVKKNCPIVFDFVLIKFYYVTF